MGTPVGAQRLLADEVDLERSRKPQSCYSSALTWNLGATPMPLGKICCVEIPANRAEDSARFYSSIFGWKVRNREDDNLAFDDGSSVGGTWVKEADRTPDEQTRLYIMVDSITETLRQIEEAGGKVLTARTDIGANRGAFAAFADPVGNEFGLYVGPKG